MLAATRTRALLLLSCALLAASRAGAPVERKEFRHFDHVPEAWYARAGAGFRNEEVQRDCRGCHDYSAGGEAHDPQAICTSCHVGPKFRSNVRPEFESGFAREAGRAFAHEDHLDLACRQCHAPAGFEIADPMPVVRGTATCIACHDPQTPPPKLDYVAGAKPDEAARLSRFLERLDASPRMQPAALALPFEHVEHLVDAARPRREECAACHDVAKLELAAGQVSTAACGTCHLSRQGPLAFELDGKEQASTSAGTFSHADHLRSARETPLAKIASESSAARIAQQGCLACHRVDPSRADPSRSDVVIAPEVKGYDGCVSCHDLTAWKTRRHGDWGRAGERDACVSCHLFGAGDMKKDRPRAEVVRPEPGALAFTMPAQRHPGIVGPPSESCSECHRAPVPELPSRIVRAHFEHASHLPPEPTAEHCAACHARTVDAAKGSRDLGTTLAGEAITAETHPAQYGRTYDADACARCHAGLVPEVLPSPVARATTVVEFPHAKHVGKDGPGGRKMDCATCHDARATAPGEPIGTRESAAACVQCHQHATVGGEPLYLHTGNLADDDVRSCARCHDAGVPAIDAVLARASSDVARVSGAQHHPPGRGCQECHLAPVSEVVAAVERFDRPESGRKRLSGRESDAHEVVSIKDSNCHGCHWAPNKDSVATAGSHDLAREAVGASLDRYPGAESESPRR